MGLSNSAATFQRLMNLVLAGLTYESCLVDLDDIVILAPTMEIHLERMKNVFDRIRQAKLKLRPDKCHLLQKGIKFLGHIISERGIAMDPDKPGCVRSCPATLKLKEVRAFVGLCFYFHRYFQGFSLIARPLHALTKKNARFEWSLECQAAFQCLKEKSLSKWLTPG